MQSLTFITFMVSEKIPVLKFLRSPDTWPTKSMKIISHWTHTRAVQFIVCMILLMYVATIQHLNYSRQSKKYNLQFIFLTHLWPWNEVKVIKIAMKMLTPKKVIIMQSLKDLVLTVPEKKTIWSFLKQGNMSFISLEHVLKKILK